MPRSDSSVSEESAEGNVPYTGNGNKLSVSEQYEQCLKAAKQEQEQAEKSKAESDRIAQEETSLDRELHGEEQVSSSQPDESEPVAETEQTIDESNEVSKEETK